MKLAITVNDASGAAHVGADVGRITYLVDVDLPKSIIEDVELSFIKGSYVYITASFVKEQDK